MLTNCPRKAYFLVPVMLNLRSALAAAGINGRVKVSRAVSAQALAAPAWSGAAGHVLQFLDSAGSPLFVKSRSSEASDAKADAAYAMRALSAREHLAIPFRLTSPHSLAVVYPSRWLSAHRA